MADIRTLRLAIDATGMRAGAAQASGAADQVTAATSRMNVAFDGATTRMLATTQAMNRVAFAFDGVRLTELASVESARAANTAASTLTHTFDGATLKSIEMAGGIKGAIQSLNGWIAAAPLAVAGVALLAHEFLGLVSAIDATAKRSDKLGIPIEKLQALQFQAELANVPIGDLTIGIKEFEENLYKLASGDQSAAEVFRRIGLSAEDMAAQLGDPARALEIVADRFQQIGSGIRATTAAGQLFGRSGISMIPLLREGSAGISAADAELRARGGMHSQEIHDAAQAFEDSWTRIKTSLSSIMAPFVYWAAKLAELIAMITKGDPEDYKKTVAPGPVPHLNEQGVYVTGEDPAQLGMVEAARKQIELDKLAAAQAKAKQEADALRAQNVDELRVKTDLLAAATLREAESIRKTGGDLDYWQAETKVLGLVTDESTGKIKVGWADVVLAADKLAKAYAKLRKEQEDKQKQDEKTERIKYDLDLFQRNAELSRNTFASIKAYELETRALAENGETKFINAEVTALLTSAGKKLEQATQEETTRAIAAAKARWVAVNAKEAEARTNARLIQQQERMVEQEIAARADLATVKFQHGLANERDSFDSAEAYNRHVEEATERRRYFLALGSIEEDQANEMADAYMRAYTAERDAQAAVGGRNHLDELRQQNQYIGLTNEEREKAIERDRLLALYSGRQTEEFRKQAVELDAILDRKQQMERMAELSYGIGHAMASGLEEAALQWNNLGDIARSVLTDLTRLGLQTFLTRPLENAIGSGLFGILGGSTANALGNVYGPNGIHRFAAGDVFTGPRHFGFSGGIGLLGEAGPEAVMPLRRGADGRLGVASSNGGSVVVNQTNNFYGGGGAYGGVYQSARQAKQAAQDALERR